MLKSKPAVLKIKLLKMLLKRAFKLKRGVIYIISGLDLFLALKSGLNVITRLTVLKKTLTIKVL